MRHLLHLFIYRHPPGVVVFFAHLQGLGAKRLTALLSKVGTVERCIGEERAKDVVRSPLAVV